MAQTFTSTDVTSGTNVFGDNQSQRVNENTLRSNFSGSSQPSDPVVGQHWYDTGNNREMTYNGTSWVAVDTNTATQVDVKNSAGNLSNLKSFLSVAHNDDGTLKVAPTSSIDEFKENSIVVTYVNPTTFTTPNDLTGIFTQYRKVKVYLSASTAISSVSSSSYDGTSNVTTVVLSTSAMDATLVSIRYSIVQYGTPVVVDRAINDASGNPIANTYAPLVSPAFSGNATATNLIVSGTLAGTLTGTATSATSDGNGNNIATTYFPKTGGTISGTVTANRVDVNDWVRTYGNNGWLNETHGGGIYMTDNDWLRAYADKGFITGGQIKAGSGFYGNVVGTLGGYTAAQLIGETSHATNGYHKFPDGTIIQWGYAAANGSYLFPIAFPNACLNVSLTAFTPTPTIEGDNGSVVLQSTTVTGFTYTDNDDGNNFPVSYIAIGY